MLAQAAEHSDKLSTIIYFFVNSRSQLGVVA